MKKIIIILSIVAGFSLILGGCSDYLDSDHLFDERRTIEDVFQNRDYTNQWLADAYYFMSIGHIQDVSSKKSIPFNFADDMFFDGESEGYAKWKSGQYNENGSRGETEPIWKNAYRGIRQASIFIQYVDDSKVFSQSEINDLKGQAYFLRAYFYWYMLRLFGPIPIIKDGTVDYTLSYEEIAQPRNTYDECVEFIVGDLITAAGLLSPDVRPMQDIARPNRGAALALRAKVLLFAASPFYNGKTPAEVASLLVNKDGKHLLPDTYDESKWAKAAAAALDVMKMGVYSLHHVKAKLEGDIAYPKTLQPFDDNDFVNNDWPNGYRDIDPLESYRSLFNGDKPANELMLTELIFTRGQNGSGEDVSAMVLHQLPRQHGKGYNSHGLTLKQCDAYYMADGTDCAGMNSMYAGIPEYAGRFNTTPRETEFVTKAELSNYPELGPNAEGVSKQFARREARFYASVAYNGSTWNFLKYNKDTDEKPNLPIFYYRGGDNGYTNGSYWICTGIGIKKYVSPQDISNTLVSAYDKTRFTKKVDPAIRYAEILLIYAEAINELNAQYVVPAWNGGEEYTIQRTTDELKKGIRPIRMRAGVPDYAPEVYNNSDLFRVKLKRERQIELFAEGHRYFDLRRWCDAPFEEPAQVYGFNGYATLALRKEFHTPTPIPALPSIFATRMWLSPINHKELRNNPNLIQNPGWTNPE